MNFAHFLLIVGVGVMVFVIVLIYTVLRGNMGRYIRGGKDER